MVEAGLRGGAEPMDLARAETDGSAVWSRANRVFREYAERNADCRKRASFESIVRGNPLKTSSPQPWPLFIDREAAGELARIGLGLDRLVKSVPQRFFGNDAGRLAAFYGAATREQAELVLGEPNGIAQAISRGDFLHGRDGLQCLELNSGGFVGGWQLNALEGLYLGCPAIARFLAEQGLRACHRNTTRLMFRHIIRGTLQAGVWKGGALNLAMLVLPHLPDRVASHSSERYNRDYRAALAEERPGLPGQVLLCGYADLAEDSGGLTFQGERVHAVLEQHDGSFDPRGFRHFKAGTVNFYSGPITRLLSDKRNLALLSERAGSQDFSAGERELLTRHLPWTRLVRDTGTVHDGRQVRLPALLAANRERFVLKKASSLAGHDVHLGNSLPQARWEDLLRQALADPDWIVQELVESMPYLFLDPQGNVVRHDLVWGLFAFGDTFGGAFLRLQPSDIRGVINVASGAEIGLLLEVEAGGAEGDQ
jgi:hypothetical protein